MALSAPLEKSNQITCSLDRFDRIDSAMPTIPAKAVRGFCFSLAVPAGYIYNQWTLNKFIQ